MNIEEEMDVGLFTKSGLTIKRDAAQSAHQAWHIQTLAVGRIRKWHANDLAKIVAAVAVLTAGEAEPGDAETGELRDLSAERATVAELESKAARRVRDLQAAIEKEAELRAAKDAAAVELALEEFRHGPLERLEKALIAFHAAHQEVAKAAAAGIRVASEFTIPFFSEELVQSWQHRKQLWCNPVPKPEPHPCTIVEFIRDYSAGNVGGGGYVKGDATGWDPEKCADLIAQGFAMWRTPSPEGEALVAAARKRLAQRSTFDETNDTRAVTV